MLLALWWLAAVAATMDICAMLERDVQGKVAPFLAGRRGLFYKAGATITPNVNTHPNRPMIVVENETLGFTHPFFRDGRARGEGIVTDEVTGTGHSLWGWEFYRYTRVLYGTVVVGGVPYPYPEPSSLVWRPDRLVATYNLNGTKIQEIKFITNDDVMLSIVTLLTAAGNARIDLQLDGHSYVNTNHIPTNDGDPANTPSSVDRDSTAVVDQTQGLIHVTEKGTAYAKPGRCNSHPKYPPSVPCKARVGRMMYDGTSVFLGTSEAEDLKSTGHTWSDSERRRWYNFTVCLSCTKDRVVLGFAQGDDAVGTAAKLKAVLNPKAALQALADRTESANHFLTTQVPQLNASDTQVTLAYYFGWAQYWMYTLDTQSGMERYGHAQSAVNNFLGLHHHDTQFYLPVGAWVADRKTYSYGNALMWPQVLPFVHRLPSYWNTTNEVLVPDNMGTTWVSSAPNDEAYAHVEGAWRVYEKSGDLEGFLRPAYDYYYAVYGTKPPAMHYGVGMVALQILPKMAVALGRPKAEVEMWETVRGRLEQSFVQQWEVCASAAWGCAVDSLGPFRAMVYDQFKDEWAEQTAKAWLLNDQYGFMPPNSTYGAVLLSSSLNMSGAARNPWLSHTPGTWWVIEGLFRRHVGSVASSLTLSHLEDMRRTYGFTLYPESWDAGGLPWGDLWYNWGAVAGVLLPLERLAGVSYSIVEVTNATRPGLFTVCDYLPPQWSHVQVRVPITTSGTNVVWTTVTVERVDSTTKRITVTGNPLGTLQLQPWLQDCQLVKASPSGYAMNQPRGHIGWNFTDAAAQSATVEVRFKC